MASIYVANPTNQHQLIHYRLEYDRNGEKEVLAQFKPANQQQIGPGQQAMLGDAGLHANQIASIISQLERYGAVKVQDLNRMPGKKITYIISEGFAVPGDVIRRVSLHNRGALIEEGRQRRIAAAVATDNTVQQAVETSLMEKGIDPDLAKPESTSVAFETVEQPDDVPSDSIAEGFDVVPDGQIGRHSGKPAEAAKGRGKGRRRG